MSQIRSQTLTIGETTVEARRLAGAVLLAMSAQFMIVIMLAAAMAPDYDFGGAAISDLGTIPETAVVFNASLVLVGVLNILGGYLFFRSHGARWLLAIYVAAGIGAIGAGAVPLDVSEVHGLFALVAFLGFNLEALGTATRLTGAMGVLSIFAGVLGLLFVVVMIVGDAGNTAAFGPIGHGGAERMIVYPVMLWLVAFGGFLLGRDQSA